MGQVHQLALPHRVWPMKIIKWQMVMEEGLKREEPCLSAKDVAELLSLSGHANRDREVFIVLLLDVKHHIIAEEVVSVGILDGSLVHPREVFKAAVAGGAAGVIIAHNHPSGDPTPSGQDREVTNRIKTAGGVLGIPLVDHVIVAAGTECYYSFRDRCWD